jgi:hypothetical protein
MMDNGSSYYDLLKHPKWQRKRLEILAAVNFTCERCHADDMPLHVHHAYYEKGLAPWEYPTESLHCLCEPCHRHAQDIQTLLKRQTGRTPLEYTEMLLGYAMGLEAMGSADVVLDVFSEEVALGIGNCFNVAWYEVWNALQEGKIDGHKLRALSKRPHRQPDSAQ